MGDDDVAEYALALRELVVNSKPVITSLTMLAGEITGNDPGLTKMVTSLIEKHIRMNRGKVKLTGFYLLDSVCKNVKGHFVQCFGANLVTTFLGAYAAVDDVTRKAMVRLLGTWNNVFPQNTLGAIQRGIAGGGGALPGPPSGVGGFGAGGGGGALPPPPMNAAAQGSLLASMLVGGGDISGLLKSIAFAKAHAHGSALPLTPGVTQQRQTALPPPPRAAALCSAANDRRGGDAGRDAKKSRPPAARRWFRPNHWRGGASQAPGSRDTRAVRG